MVDNPVFVGLGEGIEIHISFHISPEILVFGPVVIGVFPRIFWISTDRRNGNNTNGLLNL